MNRILTWFLIALIFALSGPLQAASLASARGFEKSLYGRSARQYDKYAFAGGDPVNASDPSGLQPGSGAAIFTDPMGTGYRRLGRPGFQDPMDYARVGGGMLMVAGGIGAGARIGVLAYRAIQAARYGGAGLTVYAAQHGQEIGEMVEGAVMPIGHPSLTVGNPKLMLDEMRGNLKKVPVAERQALAETYLQEIKAANKDWNFGSTSTTVSGAKAWSGDYHALVIDAEGNIFQGLIQDFSWGTKDVSITGLGRLRPR